MAFDRNKFKPAKVEVNKAVAKEMEDVTRTNSSNRGDYHTIDEGRNIFRLLPPHSEDEPSLQPKVVYWLECKVPKTDAQDNVIEGEFEWRRRPIFDSRIHGGTEKDVIDEYIKFTKQSIFDSCQDKDERSKKLAPINGWRDSKGKWNSGIQSSKSYVGFACKGDKITVGGIGRLELFDGERNELEKLNIDDESGKPLSTDIFSDPDNGVQFIIDKNKNDKGKIVTSITKRIFNPAGLKSSQVAKAYEDWAESQRVPDDVLEKFSEMEPLSDQFKGAYKKSDFERSVEALERFDNDNGYHTFQNDDFLDIVEEISAYYPDVEEGEVEEGGTAEEVLAIDKMTRDQLKAYIKEKGLGIKVFGSMSDEVIRQMIIAAENPEPEEEEEEETTSEETPVEEPSIEDEVPEEELAEDPDEAEGDLPWEKEGQAEEKEEDQEMPPAKTATSIKEKLAAAQAKAKLKPGKK